MIKDTPKSNTLATGFAMFSMFFGAGNVVFPLAIGQYAQDQNFFGILGMLISAVGVPFLGLMSMTLFNGNYHTFFERVGKVPGFLLAIIIMCLIGPFGATPRCITVAFSTIKPYMPMLSLPFFSLGACILIFALTVRKNRLIDILGYVLTPVLLISLAIIIIKGLFVSPAAETSNLSEWTVFMRGLTEGYQTMDLLGAFFFSHVVLSCLEQDVDPSKEHNFKKMIILTLKAGCIGISLLALTYIGFSYVAASYSAELAGVEKQEILGAVARLVLGPNAGIVACIAVTFACLTTALALVTVFADFLHEDVFREKTGYGVSIALTLLATYMVSILDFNGIANFLFPILQVSYPALILLCVLNLMYKINHFKVVKAPFYIAFGASLVAFLYF